MGGAVGGVLKTVAGAALTATGVGSIAGIGLMASGATDIAGSLLSKSGGSGDQPTPPAGQTDAEKAAAAEKARRETKTSLLNDQPGRQQTMLTDDSAFPYRLV